eukprot:GHVU01225129.1.p1 GENE.GHVU01225129.1~~GHVU01225129.1.p1  ORF type:complete len:122 (+),score=12.22 GHVU01225129.1:390-755(+)
MEFEPIPELPSDSSDSEDENRPLPGIKHSDNYSDNQIHAATSAAFSDFEDPTGLESISRELLMQDEFSAIFPPIAPYEDDTLFGSMKHSAMLLLRQYEACFEACFEDTDFLQGENEIGGQF